MTPNEIAQVIDRCAASITRGVPVNPVPVAKEWLRALERFDTVSPDLLGDRILATFSWWPSVADVLAVVAEVAAPRRRRETCCEDGWVQVTPWPKLAFAPCQHCTPAGTMQAYATGDPGWWSK